MPKQTRPPRGFARGVVASRVSYAARGWVSLLICANSVAAQGIAPTGRAEQGPYAFEAPCSAGEVLTGISLSDNGAGFMAIGPQCAKASNPVVKSQPVPERWYGADHESGQWAEAACPTIAPDLLSIRVQTLTNANSEIRNFRLFKLETFCGVDGSHPSREQIGGSAATVYVDDWQSGTGTQFCPAGQVAVGIRGSFQSSGEGLYELGLICGDPREGSRGILLMPGGERFSKTNAAASRAVVSRPMSDMRVQPIGQRNSGLSARLSTTAGPPAPVGPAAPPPAAPPHAALGKAFTPPAFVDGAQLWACATAAQAGTKRCTGLRGGQVFCKRQGLSGALLARADGLPDLALAPMKQGIRVRAINGDACTTNDCVVVSELHCSP